ncbi:MAG: HupE/UreJ family protein [Cyanobacteriota bacterium]|nr:HupE/UreJ family protein [Cyanobacteriota bacterium]
MLSFSSVRSNRTIARKSRLSIASLGLFLFWFFVAGPAFAHHPFGGKTPSNFVEGFFSGLGHPVVGIDHLTFVVAIGLLAATLGRRGLAIPVAFVLTATLGTGIHLMEVDLPALEIVISASVLGFGILLARQSLPNFALAVLGAAIAGIFHGYAYGEAIVGAEMNPLVAYLAGFTFIQLAIAFIAYAIGQFALKKVADRPSLALRFAGFTICGIGAAFLASFILG